jgi:hypothetical protein
MKKILICAMTAAVFQFAALCSVVQAQETGTGGGKAVGEKAAGEKERPAITDLTVSGKITKEEKQGREGKTIVHYVLTDAAGNKVMLPGNGKHNWGRHGDEKAGKDEQAAAINLEEYVNKDVTIVGKGFQKEREGKKMTHLVSITKIEAATVRSEAK